MEDFKVTQTGDEIQEILNQSPLDTANIAELEERLSDVEGKIPSEASEDNQLTDKEYVDDSISNTADELTALINGKANVADVYTKSETYNKDELDSMITTPDVQYVSVTATAQTTSVTDVLPATGAADTVYRVGSWDGTQYDADSYSEYAWNGLAYVLLNVKNTGIATGSDFDNPTAAQRELLTTVGAVLDGCDATPTAGSAKPVKSGGVYDFTNDFVNEKSMYCTPLRELPLYNKNISSSGSYSTGKHSFVRIYPGDTIIIEVKNASVNFALTKSHNTEYVDLCEGTSVVTVGGSGNPKTVTLTAPEDAKYLLIGRVVSTSDRTSYIQSIIINGYDVVTSFYNNFGELNAWVHESIEGISNDVENISTDLYGGDVEVPIILNTGTFWKSVSTVAALNDYASYYSSEPVTIEDDTDYKIEIVTASSNKQNPVLIVDENYTILKKYPRGDNHTSVTTFNIAKEDFPDGSKYILLTGAGSTRNDTKVYKTYDGIDDKIESLQYDVAEIQDIISNIGNEGRFDFNGKNIAIIGDSISTNGNYSSSSPLGNVPEIIVQPEDIGVELSAYVTYYDIGVTVGGHEITSEDVGTELTFTPVSGDEGKMVGKPKNNNSAATVVWWEVASEYLGFNPIPVSWSGSSITSHEGNDEELKTSYAWHPAQIRKCGIRTPGTMTRIAPDMIIIYRGTNDFSHSPYTRLTDYLNVYPVSIPESDTFDDGGTTRYGYLEGLAITVNKLREAYPEAQIVVCTFNYFHRVSSGQPSRNGINTIYQYNDAIRAFANYFGCGIIEFDKDGITYANAASGAYYNEGTSPTANHTHPNTKGHKVMGNRAIIDLLKVNSMV